MSRLQYNEQHHFQENSLNVPSNRNFHLKMCRITSDIALDARHRTATVMYILYLHFTNKHWRDSSVVVSLRDS